MYSRPQRDLAKEEDAPAQLSGHLPKRVRTHEHRLLRRQEF